MEGRKIHLLAEKWISEGGWMRALVGWLVGWLVGLCNYLLIIYNERYIYYICHPINKIQIESLAYRIQPKKKRLHH
jgi:hypothetical protein